MASLEDFKKKAVYLKFKEKVLQLKSAKDVNYEFYSLQFHGLREESFLNVAIDVRDHELVRHLLEHGADRRYKVQRRYSPLDVIVQNYTYEKMDTGILRLLGKDCFRAASFPLNHVMRICPDNALEVIQILLAFAYKIRGGELVAENFLWDIIQAYVNNDEGLTDKEQKLIPELIFIVSTLLDAGEYEVDHGISQVTYQTFKKLDKYPKKATEALLSIIPEERLQEIIEHRKQEDDEERADADGGGGASAADGGGGADLLPHRLNSLLHRTLRY